MNQPNKTATPLVAESNNPNNTTNVEEGGGTMEKVTAKGQFERAYLLSTYAEVSDFTIKEHDGEVVLITNGDVDNALVLDITMKAAMDYAVSIPDHSFVYPKGESEVRAFRCVRSDGTVALPYQGDYTNVLAEAGIAVNLREMTGNRFIKPRLVRWTTAGLLRLWATRGAVSIGSASNKEIVEAARGIIKTMEFGETFDIALEDVIDNGVKGIGLKKVAKYVGRLLRPYRYFDFEPTKIAILDTPIKCFSDLPSLSSFQTTRVSPFLKIPRI